MSTLARTWLMTIAYRMSTSVLLCAGGRLCIHVSVSAEHFALLHSDRGRREMRQRVRAVHPAIPRATGWTPPPLDDRRVFVSWLHRQAAALDRPAHVRSLSLALLPGAAGRLPHQPVPTGDGAGRSDLVSADSLPARWTKVVAATHGQRQRQHAEG